MLRCYCVLLIAVFGVQGGISDGYSYPVPQPPLQFDEPVSPANPIYLPPPQIQDEIPQIVPTYLPPNIYPPIGNPPIEDEIQPPFGDTVDIPSPPSNQYLPAVSTRQSPLQVLNMSCLDSRDGSGFFRTSLRSTASSRIFPVMERSSADCTVTPLNDDSFRIDLEGQRMIDCGIRNCGNRMCLTLRMATIRGLRLADDPLITLQCTPQESVVSHTKHIRINTQSEQGRSNVRSIAVASGGNQRRFETQMSLLRRSAGSDIFDQPVQQGSAVRLGDELLLRTSVRDGDGWRYSRMGAVIVRSAASGRSVTLVDEDGCRSPAMRSVSPQQPQHITPLIIQLPFRAFLFQGAAPADDLLLSVRMLGCLRPRDCYQGRSCEDSRNRIVRAANNASSEPAEIVTDYESQFQFRVLPRDAPSEDKSSSTGGSVNLNLISLICLVTVSAVLVCAAIVLVKPIVRQRLYA